MFELGGTKQTVNDLLIIEQRKKKMNNIHNAILFHDKNK
jgi:hypothetical protein